MSSNNNRMSGANCPMCGKNHVAGEHIKKVRPDGVIYWQPEDVQCTCGALLRYSVPIFKITDSGYVWRNATVPVHP